MIFLFGAEGLLMNMLHRNQSSARPMIHGSQRIKPDFVAAVAAAAVFAAACPAALTGHS